MTLVHLAETWKIHHGPQPYILHRLKTPGVNAREGGKGGGTSSLNPLERAGIGLTLYLSQSLRISIHEVFVCTLDEKNGGGAEKCYGAGEPGFQNQCVTDEPNRSS